MGRGVLFSISPWLAGMCWPSLWEIARPLHCCLVLRVGSSLQMCNLAINPPEVGLGIPHSETVLAWIPNQPLKVWAFESGRMYKLIHMAAVWAWSFFVSKSVLGYKSSSMADRLLQGTACSATLSFRTFHHNITRSEILRDKRICEDMSQPSPRCLDPRSDALGPLYPHLSLLFAGLDRMAIC